MVFRPVVRTMPIAEVREKRLLPVPGKVLVSVGQTVKASDVIAEASADPRYRLVDVARALGVPRSKANEFILCQPGDLLRAGDTLARKQGFLSRIVRSPVDGKVILVEEGQILIEEYREPYMLRAVIPAKVSAVIPDLGAELATTGMVVDGIWGNGRYNYGMLGAATQEREAEITTKDLSVEKRGLILIASRLTEAKVLEIADSLPLRGLIVGYMRAKLVPEALKVSFPIVVINGFGNRPMDSHSFKLLTTSVGQRVAMIARKPHRGRPVIVAPLPSAEHHEPPPDFDEVTVGTKVRITRAPYAGAIGQMTAIQPGMSQFPSGVKAPAAKIRLENGELALVPLANLEILVQS